MHLCERPTHIQSVVHIGNETTKCFDLGENRTEELRMFPHSSHGSAESFILQDLNELWRNLVPALSFHRVREGEGTLFGPPIDRPLTVSSRSTMRSNGAMGMAARTHGCSHSLAREPSRASPHSRNSNIA